nr:MAG: ORF1 [Torque teno midi virus]
MPFWWGRRKRFWYGTRYKRWGRRKPKYKTRRKPRRRRFRRAPRRRRRRRRKVRRKKPTLLVRQWQPDSIVLCKIKGYQSLIWGSHGTQGMCYTVDMFDYTRPKYPGGGGFCAQLFSLQYLYDQYRLKHNIWTKSNEYKDLCRYLKCYITFYRHEKLDFVITYNRQPPFEIDKLTYMNYHPYMLLQQRKKIILPSKKTNPKGKLKKRVRIKPPKQMLSKWFFQQQFTNYDLLLITASVCSLQYPRIACCNENRMLTLHCINIKYFQDSTWGHTLKNPYYYKPYQTIRESNTKFYSTYEKSGYDIFNYIKTTPTSGDTESGMYYRSISLQGGWFSPKVLNAYKVEVNGVEYKPLPLLLARYNPEVDDGKNNKVYLTSIYSDHYSPPTTQTDLIIEGQPLWLAFWGFYSYIKHKKTESLFPLYMFVVQSQYIHTSQTETPNTVYAFIDPEFLQGKNPWDSPLTNTEKTLWYPTVQWQLKTINAFCTSGPYVPKLENQTEGTWELPIHYSFHFKWGGPQITDRPVDDPSKKNKYDVPDTIKEAIQIYDPSKNIAATMFHDWDYRRGCITSTAIKRMQQNLPTDSSLQSDSDTEPQKKKRRIHPTLHDPEEKAKKINKCLLSLCEENTCQESQTQGDVFQLIQQQQQYQRNLKHNLLTLIKDLKIKQKLLQLQTGVLE